MISCFKATTDRYLAQNAAKYATEETSSNSRISRSMKVKRIHVPISCRHFSSFIGVTCLADLHERVANPCFTTRYSSTLKPAGPCAKGMNPFPTQRSAVQGVDIARYKDVDSFLQQHARQSQYVISHFSALATWETPALTTSGQTSPLFRVVLEVVALQLDELIESKL